MLTTAQRIAVSNARKFNTLAFAQNAAIEQKYWVNVLMGENCQYWVPANNREESILVKLGYEVLPKGFAA